MVRLSDYVELHCHSAFSLLDGASPPETLVARAKTLGYRALALTDHDELGGIVAFAQAAAEAGIDGIVGAELTIEVPRSSCRVPRNRSAEARGTRNEEPAIATHLVLLAEDREGYGNLSMLVTKARMERPRGKPAVPLDVLAQHARGLFALTGCARGWVPRLVARGREHEACEAAATLVDIFGGRVAIECWDHGLEEERALIGPLIDIARALSIPWVVTNDVHYADPAARIVHDVLSALRHQRTLAEMGTRARPNGEWYLKAPSQIARRWQQRPEGVRATRAIAERCAWRMDQLKPTLPKFPLPPAVEADEYLARLVEQGAHERWGRARTPAHDRQLAHELAIIGKLGLAGYFLIVWDIVRFSRRAGVLCQGRGSAANSAVCFCLGITAVDPIRLGLLFERFLSEERQEAPDIDIDFAHRDREQVLQYVYQRYGRDHAAMVCEQISYRGRSAIRDACRVLGLSIEQADELALTADRFSAKATAEALVPRASFLATAQQQEAERIGGHLVTGTEVKTRLRAMEVKEKLDAAVSAAEERGTRNEAPADKGTDIMNLVAQIVGGLHHVPRHRSIHVGGFVLTEEPLGTIVPIEPASMADRTVIQWEKDDTATMGLVKIDLLGLGMLTLIQDCLLYIRRTRGVTIELSDLDCTDQAVYDDLGKADTVGIFQVESRAQMNTLPRLKPRCFYDLVVEVALIRPGPIQGQMVHPYLRRRAGLEPVTYPHPSLEPILKRTLGVPLFQEQGMQVAITAAGFTASEADVLRRAMGHKRSHERMEAICRKMLDGMQRNGIPPDVALRIFNQINAFADYGFPESHAASFALLVYASAYLKHYYAPEYTAAILNAQPMGFYSVGTLIEDARRHGVEILPVDATISGFETKLEDPTRDAGRGARRGTRESEMAPDRFPHPAARPEPRVPSVRLGLHLVRGLGSQARDNLKGAIERGGPFLSIGDLLGRSGLDRGALRSLAESGALDCFVPDEPNARRRRAALWRMLEAERGDAGPLAPGRYTLEVPAPVAAMSAAEITAADYRMTGLSLNGHPLAHLRALLRENGVLSAREVLALPDATRGVGTAGLVICRQRPGTAKGFVFLTLEDETGLVNVVVTPKRFERQALMITRAPLILVRGTLQVEQGVVNLRGETFRELKPGVSLEGWRGHDFH